MQSSKGMADVNKKNFTMRALLRRQTLVRAMPVSRNHVDFAMRPQL
jgi:hypothetical protein